MSKTISGADLRAKLLAKKDKVVSSEEAWMDVLGSAGHRQLLSIIVRQEPRSIGDLSRIAGRAQPNVSRSLSALIQAGLVITTSNGRVSIPRLTDFGRQKAAEMGLTQATNESVTEKTDNEAVAVDGSAPYLFVSFENSSSAGRLCVNAPIHSQICVGASNEDLREIAHRLFDHWWRIWYRRDAPYKIGNFSFADDHQRTLLFRSMGSRLQRTLRSSAGSSQISYDSVNCFACEQETLKSVLRPIVAACSNNDAAFDELLGSKLFRLEDSYAQPAEQEFCRTAGALNLSPYSLSDNAAKQVRELIACMPEEDSRLDFSSVMILDELEGVSRHIEDGIGRLNGRNTLSGLPGVIAALQGQISGVAKSGMRPWQKGTSIAKHFRAHLHLAPDAAVGNAEQLAKLCGSSHFTFQDLGSNELLAFQAEDQDGPMVLVEKEGGSRGSAFVLARAVGDYLVFQSKRSCVANKYTDRQAVGRAFAAEFMAPAEGVVSMIDEEERSITQIAAHYGVSLEVVEHQYDNNYARYV